MRINGSELCAQSLIVHGAFGNLRRHTRTDFHKAPGFDIPDHRVRRNHVETGRIGKAFPSSQMKILMVRAGAASPVSAGAYAPSVAGKLDSRLRARLNQSERAVIGGHENPQRWLIIHGWTIMSGIATPGIFCAGENYQAKHGRDCPSQSGLQVAQYEVHLPYRCAISNIAWDSPKIRIGEWPRCKSRLFLKRTKADYLEARDLIIAFGKPASCFDCAAAAMAVQFQLYGRMMLADGLLCSAYGFQVGALHIYFNHVRV